MHSFYPENEGTLNISAYQTRRLRLQICAAVMVKDIWVRDFNGFRRNGDAISESKNILAVDPAFLERVDLFCRRNRRRSIRNRLVSKEMGQENGFASLNVRRRNRRQRLHPINKPTTHTAPCIQS